MNKVEFLQYICSNNNINPNEILLTYFNQVMYLYDLFDEGCQVLNIIPTNDEISFEIKFPYNIESSPIGLVLRQISDQIIKAYENYYLLKWKLISPEIIYITFSNVNQYQ